MPTPRTPLRTEGGLAPQREVLLWDDDVHERHEASLLYFWRLSFGVYYDREYIFAQLREFYANFEIPSFVAYQILGDYDLLLRLWIPRRFIPEEITAALFQFLRGTSLEQIDYLSCHTRRHWAKPTRSTRHRDESRPLEVDSVGEDVIASVNAFNRAQFDADTVISHQLDASLSPPPGTAVLRPPGTAELIAEDMLIPISLETKGIRMFVIFDRAKRAGPNYHEDVLGRLDGACDAIEKEWAQSHSVTEQSPCATGPHFSIYSGGGSMSDFLLMVRAPHGDFHEFVSIVLSRLRSIGLDKTYQIRPYTYVIADALFTDFREQRVSVVSADITAARLSGRETDTLEFKATFAVNIRRWRSEGHQGKDDRVQDAVVKSVCGFLNSLEGGVLVIGVLETEREYVAAQANGEQLLTWLEETFTYDIKRDADGALVRPLSNALIGVEHEYTQDGPYKDADTYYGALRDILKDRIDPNPLRWLRVGEREVDGRKFAVMTVRPADTWCYAMISTTRDPQFFVREAASTRAATGREAELYRDADPRGVGFDRRGLQH
jgi:hypothetical protein